jgi:GAF domain-containing protein
MADDRERLDLLYDLGKRLASMQDADELITHAAHRIREFFRAEGCSVLLLDPSGREFRFPVSVNRTGSATNPDVLSRIGFPANSGISGWVLGHGEGIWVPDVERDERFYRGVDKLTGAVTRSLMCVPLRTSSGPIGVVEVMNPVVSSIPEDDVNFLAAIASDVAAAYEKADLQRRIQQEVSELRYLGLVVGIAMITVGLLVASFAAFGHLARALPISQLLVRAEVLGGVGVAAGGMALLLAVRRAAIRRARGG